MALVHSIGVHHNAKRLNRWLNKYIFPEGELPHIQDLTHKFIDNWNLEDWQNFGLSYAKTLKSWYTNIGDWKGIEHYDQRFRRMWNYYLLGCAANFNSRGICLWQIVYTKRNSNRNDDCHYIRN